MFLRRETLALLIPRYRPIEQIDDPGGDPRGGGDGGSGGDDPDLGGGGGPPPGDSTISLPEFTHGETYVPEPSKNPLDEVNKIIVDVKLPGSHLTPPPPVEPSPPTPAGIIEVPLGVHARTTSPPGARTLTVNARNVPIAIRYGYRPCSGVLLFRKKVGGFFYVVFGVGYGPVEAIEDVEIDGKSATKIGATVEIRLGALDQAILTLIPPIEPLWTSRRPGRALVAVKYVAPTEETGDYDPYSFSCMVKGLKCWDSRVNAVAYTTNPALQLADYLTNRRYGMRFNANTEIDYDALELAADTCDAIVATPPAMTGGAPTIAIGGSGAFGEEGKYRYYRHTYTYEDADGIESQESAASNVMYATLGQGFDVSGIANGPAGTAKKRVYRAMQEYVGQPWGKPRLVGTIEGNTTTTLHDGTADADLGRTPPTGAWKQYETGFEFQQAAAPQDVIDTMRASFNGVVVWNSGRWQIHVDAARSPSGVRFADVDATAPNGLTDAEIAAIGVARRNLIGLPEPRQKGKAECPTRVRVEFEDARNNFQPATAEDTDPALAGNAVVLDKDTMTVTLAAVPYYHVALRIAKIMRRRGVYNDREYTLRVAQRGALPMPMSVIEVSSRLWANALKQLQVLTTEPDGFEWRVYTQRYDDLTFSGAPEVSHPPGGGGGPEPDAPPAVVGLTAPSDVEEQIGWVWWSAPDYPWIGYYEVDDAYPVGTLNFIRNVERDQVPVNAAGDLVAPLQLQPYIKTDAFGNRHFRIGVRVVATDGIHKGPWSYASWQLGTTGTPRDKTLQAVYTADIIKAAATWAGTRGAADGDTVAQAHFRIEDEYSPSLVYQIRRAFAQFDAAAAGFPSDAAVQSARLRINVTAPLASRGNLRNVTAHVVESTAGDEPFEVADYDQAGATSFGSRLFQTAPTVPTYVDIELNATGVAAVQAALAGNVKLAMRTSRDLLDTAPGGIDYDQYLYADGTEGSINGPQLIVTYTSDSEDDTDPGGGGGSGSGGGGTGGGGTGGGMVINRFAVPQVTPQSGNAAIDGEFRAGTFEGLLPIVWAEGPDNGLEGVIDGVNPFFFLKYVPLIVPPLGFLGGVFLVPDVDYTIEGRAITMMAHAIPMPADADDFKWYYHRARSQATYDYGFGEDRAEISMSGSDEGVGAEGASTVGPSGSDAGICSESSSLERPEIPERLTRFASYEGHTWDDSGNLLLGGTIATTTLSGAITDSQTDNIRLPWPLAAGLDDDSNVLQIDSELILTTYGNSGYFSAVRGYHGTTPAAHADGATVTRKKSQFWEWPGVPANNPAYGYGSYYRIGAAPNYDDATIGDGNVPTWGFTRHFEGATPYSEDDPTYACPGLGSSDDRLCCIEIKNNDVTGYDEDVTVVIRAVSDFSVIATNDALFITEWLERYSDEYGYSFTSEIEGGWFNVAADEEDGTFWISITPGAGWANWPTSVPPGFPMWHLAADGTLITSDGAATTLNGSINDTETGITVNSGDGFPAVPFVIQIGTEKMKVTAKGSYTNWTVERHYDGTTAASHSSGATVTEKIGARAFELPNTFGVRPIGRRLANYIDNASFESGDTIWQHSSDQSNPIIDTGGHHPSSSGHGALLGDNYAAGTDRLWQVVELPGGKTVATLEFWYRLTCADATDIITVEIRDSTGATTVETLATWTTTDDTANAWVKATFDISDHIGTEFSVHFRVTEDADGDSSKLEIDDVRVTAR